MLTIDKSAKIQYPGIQMGILAMQGVTSAAQLSPELAIGTMAEIRRQYAQLDRAAIKALPQVQPYVAYYRKFGYSYHVLGQLESIMKGKKQLHTESGLLQSMFLTEIESMLLTAGHDHAKLAMPLRLTVAAGDETYTSISGKETSAVQGDLMVCDSGGVLSSILRGPDLHSRITETTSEVLFTVYAPTGVEADAVILSLETLAGRIRTCTPAAVITHLKLYS